MIFSVFQKNVASRILGIVNVHTTEEALAEATRLYGQVWDEEKEKFVCRTLVVSLGQTYYYA